MPAASVQSAERVDHLQDPLLLSAVFAACIRWEWIDTNPADVARKPRQPTPQPEPPTADQADRIVTAAWSEGDDWGTLVWLVMVTGLRRAELLALRWRHVELDTGYLNVRTNYLRVDGLTIEKDTNTHRMRRIAVDPATVELLRELRGRYDETMKELGVDPTDDACLSYEPAYDRPYDPDGVTHKYARMCARIGIDSHLHALRHRRRHGRPTGPHRRPPPRPPEHQHHPGIHGSLR